MKNNEDNLVKSLLNVSKELKKRNEIRDFRKEFENEMSNKVSIKCELKKCNEPIDDSLLQMEVFEDKDYDVEEIKFLNFISKNKNIKSNLVRTLVYKVPESSYVVKQIPIQIESIVKTQTKKLSESISDATKSLECKLNNQIISSSKIVANESKQTIDAKKIHTKKSKTSSLLYSSNKLSSNSKLDCEKFNSEDIILIDEDDDIVGETFNQDETNSNLNNNKSSNNLNDDDEESNNAFAEENENDPEELNEGDNEAENDYDDDDFDYAPNLNRKRIQSFTNTKKRNYRKIKNKKSNISEPKVVIEKAYEPLIQTRSRRKSILKNDNESNTGSRNEFNEIQISVIGTKTCDNNINETCLANFNNNDSTNKLRVTRSKSKLIDKK